MSQHFHQMGADTIHKESQRTPTNGSSKNHGMKEEVSDKNDHLVRKNSELQSWENTVGKCHWRFSHSFGYGGVGNISKTAPWVWFCGRSPMLCSFLFRHLQELLSVHLVFLGNKNLSATLKAFQTVFQQNLFMSTVLQAFPQFPSPKNNTSSKQNRNQTQIQLVVIIEINNIQGSSIT